MQCWVCKKKTTGFCFVHKKSICDKCLLDLSCNPTGNKCANNCYVSTYSSWIADADYDWPPHCGECNRVVEREGAICRLPCYCLYHRQCLVDMLSSGIPVKCVNCGSFSPKQMQSPLFLALSKLKSSQLPPPPSSSSSSI
eukprot:gb/GEZN01027786.1/.p1 GENE.gb/GEZN01027786.1/~~gb/GEZN01027786.1/.p1  ORF type:complete len:140 (+),score=14.54 gb/GEZN01027786.1/:70-489(+)